MQASRKLWTWLAVICVLSFAVLGWVGTEIYLTAPPIPKQFVSQNGEVIISHEQILQGQSAWQTTGGMQLGSVLGHGAYQAPDWTADWLHRELVAWLNITAQQEFAKPYDALDSTQQVVLKECLKQEYRNNQVNAQDTVVLSDTRIAAIADTAKYYDSLYGNDGKDTLICNTGNDQAYGGNQDDWIDISDGIFGNDSAYGDAGHDTCFRDKSVGPKDTTVSCEVLFG